MTGTYIVIINGQRRYWFSDYFEAIDFSLFWDSPIETE